MLTILSWAARIGAIAICLLTALLCFGGLTAHLGLASLTLAVAQALPEAIAGFGLLATPFGGIFRSDFALSALGLFCIDWLCSQLASLLR